MATKSKPPESDDTGRKRQRRSRSRHAGSIAGYSTDKGQRWKFQMYVPKDPEQPELGETRLTRGGFKNLDEAQAALADAIKKKAQNEKFQGQVPTVAAHARDLAARTRGAPEDRSGTTWALHDHDDDEHL